MLSPRTMVVCPTVTPATSVIASSAPAGRIPTFSPMSAARGRAAGVAARQAPPAIRRMAITRKHCTSGSPRSRMQRHQNECPAAEQQVDSHDDTQGPEGRLRECEEDQEPKRYIE